MAGLLNAVVLRITLRATLGRRRALIFMLVPLVLIADHGRAEAGRAEPGLAGRSSSATSASRWCCR